MTEELVLSLRHVTAGYREGGVLGRKRFHEVLHDVSFDVHRGEICGLVGESGTGKSTLARTILQMVKPEQGEVIHYTKRPQMIDPCSHGRDSSALQLSGAFLPSADRLFCLLA